MLAMNYRDIYRQLRETSTIGLNLATSTSSQVDSKKSSFSIKRSFIFVLIRLYLKKQMRFLKLINKYFHIIFSRYTYQTFGINFIKFLLKKYFVKLTISKGPHSTVFKRYKSNYGLKRLLGFFVKKHSFTLLFKSLNFK